MRPARVGSDHHSPLTRRSVNLPKAHYATRQNSQHSRSIPKVIESSIIYYLDPYIICDCITRFSTRSRNGATSHTIPKLDNNISSPFDWRLAGENDDIPLRQHSDTGLFHSGSGCAANRNGYYPERAPGSRRGGASGSRCPDITTGEDGATDEEDSSFPDTTRDQRAQCTGGDWPNSRKHTTTTSTGEQYRLDPWCD